MYTSCTLHIIIFIILHSGFATKSSHLPGWWSGDRPIRASFVLNRLSTYQECSLHTAIEQFSDHEYIILCRIAGKLVGRLFR